MKKAWLMVLMCAVIGAMDQVRAEEAAPAEAALTSPLAPYRPMDILSKAPAPKGPWKFVAFGDCHAEPKSEQGNARDGFIRTFDLVDKQDPALTLLLGDISSANKGIGMAAWESFFRLAGSYITRRPYFFAIGNHDLHDPSLPPVYDKIFTAPNPVEGRAYYAFDYGDVRFIHLFDNRWNPKWGGIMAGWHKGMSEWVAAQCDSFKGKHLVVYTHCSPYTPSKYNDAKNSREIADKVLTSYTGRFTVTVLSGHTHVYYRTKRNGINFLTVSAGQNMNWGSRDLRPEAERDMQPGDVLGDAKTGIAVFTVDGDSLSLNYLGMDGKTLDSATFKK